MRNDVELDLDSLSQELRLLLFILSEQSDAVLPNDFREKFTDINWDRFLELVRHHRVYPTIYRKLKKIFVKDEWVPQYVIENLFRDYQRSTFKMLRLSAEMASVCRALSESQILSIFLKGPLLAADLYGDISLRTSTDLDIIVPINDLHRAEELLLSLGYVKDEYIQTVLGDWKWRHYHTIFYHREKGVKLELHWRLSPGPAKEPSFHELWGRRRESNLVHYPVFYLGREDLFLYLVSHGARHGWSRLRWLADINQILKQQLDYVVLRNLLSTYRSTHIGGQALVLVSQLLHQPIDDRLTNIMDRNRSKRLAKEAMFYIRQMVNLYTDPIPKEVSRYHMFHLFSLMSIRQKFLFILSFLFPYPEDAATLPLPKKLHFLYFPLRPILWLWRKTRIHALP